MEKKNVVVLIKGAVGCCVINGDQSVHCCEGGAKKREGFGDPVGSR